MTGFRMDTKGHLVSLVVALCWMLDAVTHSTVFIQIRILGFDLITIEDENKSCVGNIVIGICLADNGSRLSVRLYAERIQVTGSEDGTVIVRVHQLYINAGAGLIGRQQVGLRLVSHHPDYQLGCPLPVQCRGIEHTQPARQWINVERSAGVD